MPYYRVSGNVSRSIIDNDKSCWKRVRDIGGYIGIRTSSLIICHRKRIGTVLTHIQQIGPYLVHRERRTSFSGKWHKCHGGCSPWMPALILVFWIKNKGSAAWRTAHECGLRAKLKGYVFGGVGRDSFHVECGVDFIIGATCHICDGVLGRHPFYHKTHVVGRSCTRIGDVDPDSAIPAVWEVDRIRFYTITNIWRAGYQLYCPLGKGLLAYAGASPAGIHRVVKSFTAHHLSGNVHHHCFINIYSAVTPIWPGGGIGAVENEPAPQRVPHSNIE